MKRLDTMEKNLRTEIRTSAKQLRQEMKEEIRKNARIILKAFDKVAKEVRAYCREEKAFYRRILEHEGRIEGLEKHVFGA